MSMPQTIEELSEWQKKGHTVATIPADYITKYPSLGMHLLAALAEAEHLGLTITDGEIIIPLNDDEIATKIKSAQDSWTYGKNAYEKFLEDGTWPKYTSLWFEYLNAEGIERPTKPAEVSV